MSGLSSEFTEHNRPTLINQASVLGKIDEADDESESIDSSKLKTTETNMLHEYLANDEKLVKSEEIEFFNKDTFITDAPTTPFVDNYRHDNDTDSIDKYTKEEDNRRDETSTYDRHSYTEKREETERISKEDMEIMKLNMLRKLGELRDAGVPISQNYDMDSNLKTMQQEYDIHQGIRQKKQWIEWGGKGLVWFLEGVEYANKELLPFNFALEGWADTVDDHIDKYYDVIGEIYELHKPSGAPMNPWLKLGGLLMLSGAKYHKTNRSVSSLPDLGEGLDSNPELREQLMRQAATDRLKQNHEKSENKLNNIVGREQQLAMNRMKDVQKLQNWNSDHQMAEQRQQQMLTMQQQFMAQQQVVRQQQEQQAQAQAQVQNTHLAQQQQLQQQQMAQMQQQLAHQQLQQDADRKSYMASLQAQSGIQPVRKQKEIEQQQELARQQQIMEQKMAMLKESGSVGGSLDDIETRSTRSTFSNDSHFNKDFVDILSKGTKSRNTQSYDTNSQFTSSTVDDVDSKGNQVKIKRKRRGRKPKIKINT